MILLYVYSSAETHKLKNHKNIFLKSPGTNFTVSNKLSNLRVKNLSFIVHYLY